MNKKRAMRDFGRDQDLEQPEQEPVAWASSLDFDDDDQEIIPARDKGKLGTSNCDTPLYAVPPKQSVALTNEQIEDLLPESDGTVEEVKRRVEYRPGLWADEIGTDEAWSKPLVVEIIRAVERFHGIGEKA